MGPHQPTHDGLAHRQVFQGEALQGPQSTRAATQDQSTDGRAPHD